VVAISAALRSLLPRIHSFHSPSATMEDHKTHGVVGEKYGSDDLSPNGRPADLESLNVGENKLHRELKGRHMQMIAM
jgi:amino acid permease